jgi:hypothetical protein
MVSKVLGVLAVAGVVSGGTLSADSASAQLSVSVTVVRSCAVDARAVQNASPALRLRCTSGANSNVRLSPAESMPTPVVGSDGLHVISFNF